MAKRPDLEKLVCELANEWRTERRDRVLVDRMGSTMVRLLDALDAATLGDERRCINCLAHQSPPYDHAFGCPARRS